MRSAISFVVGVILEPVVLMATLMLGLLLAFVVAIRLGLGGVRRFAHWRTQVSERSNPAFENLVGRAMAVGPGPDIGDDLFAGGGATLNRR